MPPSPPSLTKCVPLLHSAGIPFGIQLLGADHRDGNLFAAARWIMREFA